MASKTHSPKQSESTRSRNESNPEAAQTGHRVLMPRECYDKRHPWFGSQIHYSIDVFRQLIRDARARKQHPSKDGG
jgi:hypothetical protein